MSSSKNRFERHAKLFLTLTVIVFTVILDFSFGTIYQLIAGHPWTDASLNRAISGEKAYRIKSKHYHHDLDKNVNLSGFWGVKRYPFATNSLGFKDFSPREIPLKTDKHRIIFIGDSFTEG